MSGRRINDHSFWAGGKSEGSVFPKGVHTKGESSAGGVGALGQYEDTTEAIKRQQEASSAKARSYPHKAGTRN